jgi:hypothetical protein
MNLGSSLKLVQSLGKQFELRSHVQGNVVFLKLRLLAAWYYLLLFKMITIFWVLSPSSRGFQRTKICSIWILYK